MCPAASDWVRCSGTRRRRPPIAKPFGRHAQHTSKRVMVARRDGCEWAGYLFVAEVGGLPQDFDKAVPLYERACADDRANACLRLGAIYEMRKDGARAATAFRKACKGGEQIACERTKKKRAVAKYQQSAPAPSDRYALPTRSAHGLLPTNPSTHRDAARARGTERGLVVTNVVTASPHHEAGAMRLLVDGILANRAAGLHLSVAQRGERDVVDRAGHDRPHLYGLVQGRLVQRRSFRCPSLTCCPRAPTCGQSPSYTTCSPHARRVWDGPENDAHSAGSAGAVPAAGERIGGS